MSGGKPGLLGACIARAEAITLRLAMIYALLDSSPAVKRVHLEAALAVWTYAEASARYIFGDAVGDPVCDDILNALRNRADGMTRTDISELFGRNRSSGSIGQALASLLELGKIRMEVVPPDGLGRPAERWFAK